MAETPLMQGLRDQLTKLVARKFTEPHPEGAELVKLEADIRAMAGKITETQARYDAGVNK